MKHWLWLILFSCLSLVGAAGVKVAIFGDSGTVDWLMAEISGEVELFERDQISKILREHQLSEANLTETQMGRYFPHCDIFVLIRSNNLIAFNAKNGFRLENSTYENLAEALDLTRRAIKRQKVENPILFSIVSVRDIGVPRKYKPRIAPMTANVEKELMKYVELQMLERTHLEKVLRERQLTSISYKLAQAAKLLRMEFEPGSEGGVINLRFYITDAAGKILAKHEIKNIFGDENVAAISAKEIYKQLSEHRSL